MATFLQRFTSAGGALVASGLLIWLMAWAIDFWGHYTGSAAVSDNGHGGDALVRVNFTLSGLPLIVMGGIILFGGDRLVRPGNTWLFITGLLIALDGQAHAFAFNDHLNDPLWAVLFAMVAPAQIALGIALPYLDRRLDRWWVLGTAALFFGYIATRTVSVPALGFPEAVEGLDIFSKFTELVTLVVLAPGVLRSTLLSRGQPARSEPAPAGAK
jgi:hypothetical protein